MEEQQELLGRGGRGYAWPSLHLRK
jgi:hypothetical protein